MQVKYTIDLQTEDNINIQNDISQLITEHQDEVRKKEPTGALGVGEVFTIVIAVNATFQSSVLIADRLSGIISGTDASARIDNPETCAVQYIIEHTTAQESDLELVDRASDGDYVVLEFAENDGPNHIIRLNIFDPDLSNISYSRE